MKTQTNRTTERKCYSTVFQVLPQCSINRLFSSYHHFVQHRNNTRKYFDFSVRTWTLRSTTLQGYWKEWMIRGTCVCNLKMLPMIAVQCRTVKWWHNCSSCLHNDTFEWGPVTSHIEYHHLLFFPSFYIPGQNYLVAIKTAAGGSAGKPQVPTPAGASTKPTVAGKSTGPTVATPSTGAPTSSPQSSVEAKVSKAFTL